MDENERTSQPARPGEARWLRERLDEREVAAAMDALVRLLRDAGEQDERRDDSQTAAG